VGMLSLWRPNSTGSDRLAAAPILTSITICPVEVPIECRLARRLRLSFATISIALCFDAMCQSTLLTAFNKMIGHGSGIATPAALRMYT
jgi:hypothetical protein